MREATVSPVPVADTPQPQATTTPVAPTPVMSSGPQYDHAVEIAQLCQLASMSDKTAEFLSSGQSVAQVRQTLLTAKAAIPAISSHINPPQSPQTADLLMKIVKQRTGKE